MAGVWNFAGARVHPRTGSGLLRAAVRAGRDQRHRDRRNGLAPAACDSCRFAAYRCRAGCTRGRSGLSACPRLAAMAACCGGAPRRRMIWAKLVFGGFGRRGLEAIVALGVLAVGAAIVAAAMMVIEGARGSIARAERE